MWSGTIMFGYCCVERTSALPAASSVRVGERQLRMAKQLISSPATEFEPEKYHDT